MKTGVIGLGGMGAPIARNLHRAGYLEAVWNRTAEKSAHFAAEYGVDVATDPEALAVLPEWHSSSRCCLCGQRVGGNKGVKQHLNRQHADLMHRIVKSLQGKLRAFKNMLEKHEPCRYCHTRVDAPSRHAEQRVALLQAHVLHELSLDPTLPVESVREGQVQPPNRRNAPHTPPGRPGTDSERTSQPHLPMRNPRNQCYAIAVHQALRRSKPGGLSDAQGRAFRAAAASSLAPSDSAFRSCAGAWTLDGTRQDAAEFLTHLLRVASQDDIQWEARLQLEGRISTEDLGISPIPLPYLGNGGLLQQIDHWGSQPVPHALSSSADLIVLQLPRFVDGRKVLDHIQLHEKVFLPQFEADSIQVQRIPYRLTSFIIHLGHTPHSGHYRTAILTSEGWQLGDDDKPLEPLSLQDPLPLSSAYLVFLEKAGPN